MIRLFILFALIICGQHIKAKEPIAVIRLEEGDSVVLHCRQKANPIVSEFFKLDSSIALVGINDTSYFVIVGKQYDYKFYYAVVNNGVVSVREGLKTHLWNPRKFKKHKRKCLRKIQKAGDIYAYPYDTGFIIGVKNCEEQYGNNVYFTIYKHGVMLTECRLPIVYNPKPIDSNLWGFMIDNLLYELCIDTYSQVDLNGVLERYRKYKRDTRNLY